MKNEYRFTFTRWTRKGPEETSEAKDASCFDEAVLWANGVCKANECVIKQIEWFDEDLQRWQKSTVSYT